MTDAFDVHAYRGNGAIHVAELRQAFDQSFAEAAGTAEKAGDLVLAIRAGSDQHVVRLSEIAGIHVCPKIVALPGTTPTCLGLVGLRGRLHAVFRLSALLGDQRGQPPPRWLLIAPGRDAPTFAVDAVDACLAVAPEELRPVGDASHGEGHLHALFVRDGIVRGLLHVPTLVARAQGDRRG
jgi:chemotaxis signal transduction protein